MIIFNTTFHVNEPIVGSFKSWVRDIYIPKALETDGISAPEFAKILIEVQEGYASFAVQFKAESLDAAVKWHDGDAAVLRHELSLKFGDKVLFFTTYMESLEIK